jgi:hypothetical protein
MRPAAWDEIEQISLRAKRLQTVAIGFTPQEGAAQALSQGGATTILLLQANFPT